MKTLINRQDDGDTEAADLSLLARTLKDLSSAQKTDLEFRTRLRDQWRAEMAERTAAAATEVKANAKSKGLSDEDAERMRQIVLGVVG